MVGNDDLEWLAGLADAEACFHVSMNGSRKSNIVTVFQIGLVRCDVMEAARRIVIGLVGSEVPELHVRRATETQREFFSLTVAAKEKVLTLVEALQPRLHGKCVEALILRDILKRSVGTHYSATDHDRELCELSHRIKKGDSSAKVHAASLLGAVRSTLASSDAWLAGLFDGDGSVSIVCETRGSTRYYSLVTNVSSSDRAVLEDVRGVVAQRYTVTKMTTHEAKGGARRNYTFHVATADTERFLTDMRPYLRVKGVEADVMVDVCRGALTREAAYPILRALKKADDPGALLASIAAGDEIPSEPQRTSRVDQYRRLTYGEMEARGWWSADEARQRLGGLRHAAWAKIVSDLKPSAIIGNKKYYEPKALRAHVSAALSRIVRSDARNRIQRSMEAWGL